METQQERQQISPYNGPPVRTQVPTPLPFGVFLKQDCKAFSLFPGHRSLFAFLKNCLPMISRPKEIWSYLKETQRNFNHRRITGPDSFVEVRVGSSGKTEFSIAGVKVFTCFGPFLTPRITLVPPFHGLMNTAREPVYLIRILDHPVAKSLSVELIP
jgi:hypothetical protein